MKFKEAEEAIALVNRSSYGLANSVWSQDLDRANQVAERLQERHPGKMVSMYAYINHSTPPVQTPVSPYVVIFFTTSVYCGGHGIDRDARAASSHPAREAPCQS